MSSDKLKIENSEDQEEIRKREEAKYVCIYMRTVKKWLSYIAFNRFNFRFSNPSS